MMSPLASGCVQDPNICNVVTADPGPQTPQLFQLGDTVTADWTEAAASVSTNGATWLDGILGMNFTDLQQMILDMPSPTGLTLWDDGSYQGEGPGFLQGRCDDEAPGAGCVNEDFIPTLVYNAQTNPKVLPVAQHIFAAQHSLPHRWGVPASGNYLEYDPIEDDQTANRNDACGSFTPPPGSPNTSCDEYPMASTYEGAHFQSDYSIQGVPQSANDSQGGITGAFYNGPNRIIDEDPFWVNVVLADGTTSW
jgi:hypothetical protein